MPPRATILRAAVALLLLSIIVRLGAGYIFSSPSPNGRELSRLAEAEQAGREADDFKARSQTAYARYLGHDRTGEPEGASAWLDWNDQMKEQADSYRRLEMMSRKKESDARNAADDERLRRQDSLTVASRTAAVIFFTALAILIAANLLPRPQGLPASAK